MRNLKIKPLHCIFALLVCILCCATVFLSACSSSSSHSTNGDYRYRLDDYYVEFDISDNCAIAVTEILDVHYIGKDSTGFYRDIPVNAGAVVKNIKVTGVQLLHGETKVLYDVIIEDNDFVTVDIGSTRNKTGENETYRLTYDYYITNSVVKDGLLPVVPVGTGWDCEIKSATVKLILPDGFESALRYVGKVGVTNSDTNFIKTTENGRTVITSTASGLGKYEGITFDLNFAEGAIRPYFDFTPYYFVIAAAALLVILIVVKLIFFNKRILTPVVNFEAPDGMNPLLMGKLIDNKVNSEDVTALIYYWADKGYIKISFENKNNPTLIRIKDLPDAAEDYEHTVFKGLFRKGDSVKTSELRYKFYPVFERATAQVNAKTKGVYESSSIGTSIAFALLGGLIAGIAPLIIGFATISFSLFYLYGFLTLIPALVMYGVSESVKYYRLKRTVKKSAPYLALLSVATVGFSLMFTLFMPKAFMTFIPNVILNLLSYTTVCLSVMLIQRTPEYNEKLNHIVGFRNFIIHAEKDRLEALLESDPQYYYHVLPYAQVLDVTDKWEEKFRDLTVPPPAWATMSGMDVVNFIVLNRLIRHSMTSIATGMISRPSSSGRNGGGGRHFGGGGGRGFGGGGGRGR